MGNKKLRVTLSRYSTVLQLYVPGTCNVLNFDVFGRLFDTRTKRRMTTCQMTKRRMSKRQKLQNVDKQNVESDKTSKVTKRRKWQNVKSDKKSKVTKRNEC